MFRLFVNVLEFHSTVEYFEIGGHLIYKVTLAANFTQRKVITKFRNAVLSRVNFVKIIDNH